MRTRWLVLLVVLVIGTLMVMSVRAGHADAPASWAAIAANAPGGTRVEMPVYAEDGARTASLGLGGAHEDAAASQEGSAAKASASASASAKALDAPAGPSSSTSLSVLERAGVTRSADHLDTGSIAGAASLDAGAAQNAASGALDGGSAAAGPLPRATVVKTAAGTANIYNSAVAVGFMFDPSDNPQHRLEFTGPQVSQAEFSLHGSAAGSVTIDGQPAIAGQWYPLHAGLTIVAPQPVGIHVRPAPPHSNG
jgi:hypothetical protein